MTPIGNFKTWIVVLGLTLAFHLLTPSSSVSASEFKLANREELNDKMLRIRATQFLQRTTFGPKNSEIDALAERMGEIGIRKAAGEWIDEQLKLPATRQVDLVKQMLADDGFKVNTRRTVTEIRRYRDHAWWHASITAPDQLRQRIAWALSQIFVINDSPTPFRQDYLDVDDTARWLCVSNYYDQFVDATDSTYRDLLEEVTFSPVMGHFLGHLYNSKGNPEEGRFPDENFAREILQLFSIGLHRLHRDGRYINGKDGQPIPTYSNDEIQEFSRLFTGFKLTSQPVPGRRGSLILPMRIEPSHHDHGAKTLLRGKVLPADMDPMDDIQAGLDNIASHPNVGPFISRQLIQRLVSSNPSRNYIRDVSRVFDDNGNGVRGDLAAVVKEILLNREAWGSLSVRAHTRPLRVVVRSNKRYRDRMNEPILAALSLIRRYGSSDYPTGRFMLPNDGRLQQAPFASDTVFNFYLPDFQAPGVVTDVIPHRQIPNGKVVSPELQLMHASGMVDLFNYFHNGIEAGGFSYRVDKMAAKSSPKRMARVKLDFSVEESLADDPAALAEYLDLTLCTGTMTKEARKTLTKAIEHSSHPNADVQRTCRARGAMMAVYTSPAFWIVD